ncbi:hypothetical protein CPter291_1348 [Collimonas pratensis]|uniref:Uncharacterized protein n=1 Tax=Collimonas pratensis TaxID=279113 RepID=A0ABN4MBI0_9BURK|nr:hypothetical protein CPter291_1348 [Collimonas pratensis]
MRGLRRHARLSRSGPLRQDLTPQTGPVVPAAQYCPGDAGLMT